jgi:hypothetical protein
VIRHTDAERREIASCVTVRGGFPRAIVAAIIRGTEDKSEKLRGELRSAYRFYTLRAYANYVAYHTAYAAALAASALATIAVATDLFARSVQATLTAGPGVILVAVQSLRFHAKYRWHQRHAWAVRGIQHQLDYEEATVQATSRRLRHLRAGYARSYPALRLALRARRRAEQTR